MNSASWPAGSLHAAQIFVAETDTREAPPGITSDNKRSSPAGKEFELVALRVTARRHRKETSLLSWIASRGDQRITRSENLSRSRRQTIRYQMVARWLHRVQCHSNWRIRRKVAPREKRLRSSVSGNRFRRDSVEPRAAYSLDQYVGVYTV